MGDLPCECGFKMASSCDCDIERTRFVKKHMMEIREQSDAPATRVIPPWVEDDLAKQNARLRNALRQITNTTTVSECQKIAREALGE